MAEREYSDNDGPDIDDNVIRIQLRRPSQRGWELRTRNHSPGIKFPTIQLFDCEGNLLIETNDDNISIKSNEEGKLKTSQSLREKDFRHIINKNIIRKHKSISGDRIYTRVYNTSKENDERNNKSNCSYVIKNDSGVCYIPKFLCLNSHGDTSLQPSDVVSEISSYKSSDNESILEESKNDYMTITSKAGTLLVRKDNYVCSRLRRRPEAQCNNVKDNVIKNNKKYVPNKIDIENQGSQIQKSKSFNCHNPFQEIIECLPRSKSGIVYTPPQNKISFLNTYLKSLPGRTSPNPDWFELSRRSSQTLQPTQKPEPTVKLRDSPKFLPERTWRFCKIWDNTSENDSLNIPTDVAAEKEMKKRLKIYRRGMSEIEPKQRKTKCAKNRRHSVSDFSNEVEDNSSSESIDEADLVLNRLRRRIMKNKMRAKRKCSETDRPKRLKVKSPHPSSGDERQDVANKRSAREALVRPRITMGSNISQHSAKGLKGRRARSSGDLCNGDTKSQTESSVCGSVVGDVMGWNRSLPNHLDGNRHLADYSRVNNNYGDLGSYNRCHPKGGRGLRYRVSQSGSELEPVWKLQDPGCDQGYGSERSPEEDYAPPLQPSISLEEYEAQLRVVYPFISDDNSFTVVVEKDGRGLGMSVCGAGGLVKIRRLYPPQPAWRTGRLAPRDLLLAANGVPLAGLSTYEALEVLRTATPRVELRVCRPPPDVLESITPPDPPTPPARTPHPPSLPPPDPLNCHPMHARLSQTTSSATTSSSEGRGRREPSPEHDRPDLRLPELQNNFPVYDVQYGEFDIVMSKVNGSLGFTLRKEDHSALGHYVRALVREPALSDGRIQPGDRIVAVNETSMSNMSHADAVSFLRSCGAEVRLRLYRDHAATPLSPMSPHEEGPTDTDTPASRPKPPLRPEAVSMLCDLAARRLTPDTSLEGSRSPCLSPRKFRKLTKDSNHYEQPELKHIECQSPAPQSDEKRRQRTHSLNQESPTRRKQKLSLTVPPHGYELNNLDNDTLDAPNVYQEDPRRFAAPIYPADSDEPVSMPVISCDEARFCHSNPTYQSAVICTSSDAPSGSDDAKNLKKWKAVTLSPDNERKVKIEPPKIVAEAEKKENNETQPQIESSSEPTIMTVELNRGWNSRLGFSVQSHPDSGQSYISAVYNDSVAARDGRLRRGDVILQVNDENVTSMKAPEVIDLLRILRGSICITVLRPPNPQ